MREEVGILCVCLWGKERAWQVFAGLGFLALPTFLLFEASLPVRGTSDPGPSDHIHPAGRSFSEEPSPSPASDLGHSGFFDPLAPSRTAPLCSSFPLLPSTIMSTPPPVAFPRGFNYSSPTCGVYNCNGRGLCAPPPDASVDLACVCKLGYSGQFCERTVNGSLSVPLTLSVLTVIVGLLVLAFIVAKLRQRQKKEQRRRVAARQGYNIAV